MVALPRLSASAATLVLPILIRWHKSNSTLAFLHPPSNFNVGVIIQSSPNSLGTKHPHNYHHRRPPNIVGAPSRTSLQLNLANLHHLLFEAVALPSQFLLFSDHDIDFSSTHHLLLQPQQPQEQQTSSTSLLLSFVHQFNNKLLQLSSMDPTSAEQLAGPFFGASLFPYLAFLFFLNVPQNETPRGVIVGFATCLLFVFLTIPAAILAKVWYNVSLADCDWLHGSAESLLTITNLVTVVAFRQALNYRKEIKEGEEAGQRPIKIPESYVSYKPMIQLVGILTAMAFVSALIPAVMTMGDYATNVHTPYLGGFMDLPDSVLSSLLFQPHSEPENALTIATWIIHISSLVEFLVAMGFCWRWAEISNNPRWKGLTWGLIPLHSSGITACTYHLFYNSIPVLVPLQAFLTFVGNTTAMYAAYRIAISNGWDAPWKSGGIPFTNILGANIIDDNADNDTDVDVGLEESQSLLGFEDFGDALAEDDDYSFILKLFAGCAVASYVVKYGELCFDFPFESELSAALAFIFIPSMLNAFKWYKRSRAPKFEGWI